MNTQKTALAAASCLAAACSLILLGGCSGILQRTSAKEVPFTYYGRIAIGAPVVEERRVVVPIALSQAPPIDSAWAPYRIKTHVADSEINMTIVVALVGDSSLKKCQLELPRVSPGEYAVFFRDPDGARHKVGQITISQP